MKKWILSFCICLLLYGCLLGPNYRPPENGVWDGWSTEPPEDPCICLYDDPPVAWWLQFNDPLLNQYIHAAAWHNNDVLIAEANILQARAMRMVTASALFPQINGDLNVTRTYFSKNGPVFAIGLGSTNTNTGIPFQIQIPQIQSLYNALIDVSWEIDIFGKTARAVEAADAQIGSAIEHRNDVLISVLAEVARNYVELRSNQRRGELIEENIQLLEKNTYIIQRRLAAGYANGLDLDRIEAELAEAEADLPDILAQIYQNIYAISVLTGALPEQLLCELLPIQPMPTPSKAIAIGIRSDLLRRRPDVRQTERQLAAATANIGVAIASFFPTFTLTGDIGLQSLEFKKLFQAKSLTWAIGGDINIPIFQGGRLVGNLHLAEAQAASAAFAYQRSVITALQEAESALVAYTQELKASEQLTLAAILYERLISITNERYTKGLVSLTDLLDSERQWNAAEQNLLTSETVALVDLITLYKALGGGWQPVDCF